MHIIEDLCRPSECNLECIDACKSIQSDDACIKYEVGDSKPIIDESNCTDCLSCIRACPFNAIVMTTDDDPKETEQDKEIKPSHIVETVYEVVSSYERFPEADMVFARVYGDPSFEHYEKPIYHGSESMIKKKITGYDRLDFELSVATWKLYDNRRLTSTTYDVDRKELREKKKCVKGDAKAFSRKIKRVARFLGASLVGIAKLDRRWIYKTQINGEPYDIPDSIDRAIVLAVEMDYEKIGTSPAYPSAVATALGYSKMAFLEIELADFIERLGYHAIPCGNNVALSVPLAIDAGLGQYGRHGLLITKEYGPRVRIAKILTDIPLIPDKPNHEFCEAVIRFCEVCMKCAETCPSQSISYEKGRRWKGETKSNNPGTKKWYVNPVTCYGFWTENGDDCSNCIRSCPYNKPNDIMHKTVLWLVQHVPWLNPLVVKMDDLFGYGKQRDPRTVWQKHDE